MEEEKYMANTFCSILESYLRSFAIESMLPTSVAIDSLCHIYISDSDKRLIKYSHEGELSSSSS